MTDAQFLFWALVVFVALLFVVKQALAWVKRLVDWWDGRVAESMEPGWWEK